MAITGQVGTDKMHITSHQYLDLTERFRPITKRSKQVVRPDTVTEIVRLAFKYAESEKPGAVHIDLLDNIARMPVSGSPLQKTLPQISDSLFRILHDSDFGVRKEPEDALLLKKQMTEKKCLYRKDRSFPMKPQTILSQVREVLGHDDILISDVGAHKVWVARNYDCYRPNTCIISNGFASMGIAIPGAVSAKLVYPDKKVLEVTGDGGFMMNMQELETAVRYNLTFVVLIWNDSSYGLIKWKERMRFEKTACVDFTNPDFMALAKSMHCKGYRVEKADDLIPILQEAFRQKVPSVIDCRVDYSENVKLSLECCPNFH